MKKILFLVSSMHGGGAERVAALLCNHWVIQGYEVVLMPTFSGRGDCVYPLDERVRLDYLADHVGCLSRSFINKIRRLFVLRRVIRKNLPDIIISFMTHVNVAAIVATWGLRIPVIVSERTYPPAMPLGIFLEMLRKWAYPRANAVVVQTEQTLEWLTLCCPKAQGYVIHNPVVLPLPETQPIVEPASIVKQNSNVILAVGRLGIEKGFDLLLQAFQTLVARFPGWKLVILGEGSERKNLGQQCEKLGLNSCVHIPGRVGNLSDWYARADIYVMSSRFEGFPNSLIEALAHGLPAVSFDCRSGPREIIRHEVDGLLVSPVSGAQGLSESLSVLMSDEKLRHRMAKSAIDVQKRFAIDLISLRWLKCADSTAN